MFYLKQKREQNIDLFTVDLKLFCSVLSPFKDEKFLAYFEHKTWCLLWHIVVIDLFIFLTGFPLSFFVLSIYSIQQFIAIITNKTLNSIKNHLENQYVEADYMWIRTSKKGRESDTLFQRHDFGIVCTLKLLANTNTGTWKGADTNTGTRHKHRHSNTSSHPIRMRMQTKDVLIKYAWVWGVTYINSRKQIKLIRVKETMRRIISVLPQVWI